MDVSFLFIVAVLVASSSFAQISYEQKNPTNTSISFLDFLDLEKLEKSTYVNQKFKDKTKRYLRGGYLYFVLTCEGELSPKVSAPTEREIYWMSMRKPSNGEDINFSTKYLEAKEFFDATNSHHKRNHLQLQNWQNIGPTSGKVLSKNNLTFSLSKEGWW